MFKQLTLQGFKSFVEEGTVALRPITLLTGVNSSGKSSIFQSLLLLKQSFEAPPIEFAGLALNGPCLSLGSFRDISTEHRLQPISLGITFGMMPDPVRNAARLALLSQDSPVSARLQAAHSPLAGLGLKNEDELEASLIVRLQPDGTGTHPNHAALERLNWSGYVRYVSGERVSIQCKYDAGLSGLEENLAEARVESRQYFVEAILKVPTGPNAREEEQIFQLDAPISGLEVQSAQWKSRRLAMHSTFEQLIEHVLKSLFRRESAGSLDTLCKQHLLPSQEKTPNAIARQLCRWVESDGSEPVEEGKHCLNLLSALLQRLEGGNQGPKPFPDDERILRLKNTLIQEQWDVLDLIIKKMGGLQNTDQRYATALLTKFAREAHENSPIVEALGWQEWLERSLRAQGSHGEQYQDWLPPLIEREVRTLFTESLFYLGPVREEPRNLYGIEVPSHRADVGRRGERSVACLNLFGHELVLTPEPGGELLEPRWIPLRQAVSEWGSFLGVIDSLSVDGNPKYGMTCRVATPDGAGEVSADLVNVGVGVSQVLPVLVLCLGASIGCTLLLEQPELHLHPAVQNRLAEFFAACAMSGRQLLIETHSEHLIHRLRLLIAKGQLNAETDVSLIYIERDRFGSTPRTIPIGADGALEEWPRGFFDQTEQNLAEIMKARFARRR